MSPCLAIISFQGDSDGAEAQVAEAAARAPAAQDNQPHSEAEGCVRLRRHLAQERLQHPPRLHTLSGEREGEALSISRIPALEECRFRYRVPSLHANRI